MKYIVDGADEVDEVDEADEVDEVDEGDKYTTVIVVFQIVVFDSLVSS